MGRKVYNVTQRAQVRCRSTKDPGVKAVAVTAWADGYRAACKDMRKLVNQHGDNAIQPIIEIVTDYNGRLR